MSAISRRDALAALAGAVSLPAVGNRAANSSPTVLPSYRPTVRLAGRLKQSVCRWCYGKMPLEDLCREAKGMGLGSVEILGEEDWPTVKRLGLTCAMPNEIGRASCRERV